MKQGIYDFVHFNNGIIEALFLIIVLLVVLCFCVRIFFSKNDCVLL